MNPVYEEKCVSVFVLPLCAGATYKLNFDMAIAFDCDMLSSHYNINLEVSNTTEPDEFSK